MWSNLQYLQFSRDPNVRAFLNSQWGGIGGAGGAVRSRKRNKGSGGDGEGGKKKGGGGSDSDDDGADCGFGEVWEENGDIWVEVKKELSAGLWVWYAGTSDITDFTGNVLPILPECLTDITGMSYRYYRNVLPILPECLTDITGMS